MKISLEGVGKKFNYEWIFRKIDLEISPEKTLAVTGSNGSGKSTLLQIISGHMMCSEGTLTYERNAQTIKDEVLYKHISIAAPYLELIEEFTVPELVNFHLQFKKFFNSIDTARFLEITGLFASRHKPIKYFSSGMKQRVKLALAILSETDILLLDEPTSNLDSKAVDWYQHLISDYGRQRTIIVCSNLLKQEYEFCTNVISINDYKK